MESHPPRTFPELRFRRFGGTVTRTRYGLYGRVLGSRRLSAVAARVKAVREQVTQDRRYLAQIDALPPDEAVKLVHERAARAEEFIVVDHELLLITSANFSFSAENRNIEFGILIRDTALAASVETTMRSKHGSLYELVP